MCFSDKKKVSGRNHSKIIGSGNIIKDFLIIALERCLVNPEKPCFLLFFGPN